VFNNIKRGKLIFLGVVVIAAAILFSTVVNGITHSFGSLNAPMPAPEHK